MQESQELGEAEAGLAIAAMHEELARRGKVAVIAVGDSHGELISLLRMDGAPLPSVDVATRKVLTAAREKSETGALGRNFQKSGWQMANTDPRFTGWDGGIPVSHRGRTIGAVAVSGLDQSEDAEIARIGVARIVEKIGK
jgi:glc operon protein GlcG